MIKVVKEGVVLDVSDHVFEKEGVLNPAIYQDGNKVHMFYRTVRKGNHSTIGYCLFNGPILLKHRNEKPLFRPDVEIESQGVEDARIVKIDN